MVNSHSQDFVEHGPSEFVAKRAFQRSTRKLSVCDNVFHRQIGPEKVSLDVF